MIWKVCGGLKRWRKNGSEEESGPCLVKGMERVKEKKRKGKDRNEKRQQQASIIIMAQFMQQAE